MNSTAGGIPAINKDQNVKKIKYLVAGLLGLILSTSILAAEQKLLDFETLTLDNGLQVIIVPNHRAPVVFHSLWYKVGSGDSPSDKTGIAHFVEHLMYKGTNKFPKDAYKQTINKLGGEQNASTTWDRTVFFVTLAKEYLTKVMELEADRMTNLAFPAEEFEKERLVVLQERNQRTEAIPEGRLGEATNASVFWQHPYGKPIIGFKKHIEQYTIPDVKEFYTKWYAPNNAILVIAGDITLAEIKPLINKYYAPIKKKVLPIRQRLEEPDHSNATAKVEIRDTQLKSMFFERFYKAPNHRTSNVQKESALILLADILGNETNGRLHKALVEQQKTAHSAAASYLGYLLDPYSFIITATPVNAIDFVSLEAAVEAEVQRLIANGVTDQELALAKKEYLLQFRYNHDSLSAIAEFIGENMAHGYSLAEIQNTMAIIEKVTPAEVNSAAKEILGTPATVVSYAYPIIQN
jgi:zinc protease